MNSEEQIATILASNLGYLGTHFPNAEALGDGTTPRLYVYQEESLPPTGTMQIKRFPIIYKCSTKTLAETVQAALCNFSSQAASGYAPPFCLKLLEDRIYTVGEAGALSAETNLSTNTLTEGADEIIWVGRFGISRTDVTYATIGLYPSATPTDQTQQLDWLFFDSISSIAGLTNESELGSAISATISKTTAAFVTDTRETLTLATTTFFTSVPTGNNVVLVAANGVVGFEETISFYSDSGKYPPELRFWSTNDTGPFFIQITKSEIIGNSSEWYVLGEIEARWEL